MEWILVLSSIGILILLYIGYKRVHRDDRLQEHLVEEMELEKTLTEEPSKEDQSEKESELKRRLDEAEAAFKAQDYPKAEEHYLAIIEDRRGDAIAHFRLGIICLQKEDFKTAETYLTAATNIEPAAEYFIHLAESLLAQDRMMEAAQAYESALEVDPRQNSLYGIVAELYGILQNHEKAAYYLDKTLRFEPSNPNLRRELIREYEAAGNFEAALRTLRVLLNLKPYDEELKAWAKRLEERM